MYTKCPIDDQLLVVSERSNIEIDYCPTCRGVWLDRGELDKMIERASMTTSPNSTSRDYEERQYSDRHKQTRHHDYDHEDDLRYKKKRKESFLGDLFDF